MSRAARLFLLAALAAVPAAGRGGELEDDLKARRARLLEKLDPETIFVLFSSPPRVYSLDVDYEYRQDSDMLYLTGIDQEDTTLVLMPGNKTKKEILFVHDPDPRREHWNGHLLTTDEAKAATGIDTVYLASQWRPFIAQILNGSPYPRRSGTRNEEFDPFFEALKAGKAEARPRLRPPAWSPRASHSRPGFRARHPRAQRGRRDPRRDRSRLGAAPGEDGVRAQGTDAQRRDLGRGPRRGHEDRAARTLGVRGGGRPRAGLPRERRHEPRLSLDRGQRARTRRSSTTASRRGR